MKLEDVRPAHCYARVQRLLAETSQVRDELGRSEDARPGPEISGAEPREVYFEALVAWHKVQRLGEELGVHTSHSAPATPTLVDVRPGHVLGLLDAVLAILDAVQTRLGITVRAPEPAIETSRQPSDVLAGVIRVNRELSRALERPFTPTDVYRTVALASTYASRLGGTAPQAEFIRRRKPADCYARLEACLTKLATVAGKRGQTALTARGAVAEVVPGDVYDLANLVLGELAFLHALSPSAPPVHAFEPAPSGRMLPSHVDQLARTLEAQLASLK